MLFFPQRLSPSQRRRLRQFNVSMASAMERVAAMVREGVKARLAEPGPPLRWTDGPNEYGTRPRK